MHHSRTRQLRIVAQDPSIKKDGKILTASVTVPSEEFAPGPNGYRVHVIDYDSSTGTHYMPKEYPGRQNGRLLVDPFDKLKNDEVVLENPQFHAQNVYAIVMRTLARFEFALGRRISWGFDGHQINVAPHAFADANAFYSKYDRALMFGYFQSPISGKNVFTCLSHDIVVHETTHALVDGLRERFIAPSSPEQAGFHEGFADVVALLSVFSLREVIAHLIDGAPDIPDLKALNIPPTPNPDLIDITYLKKEALKKSVLFGLADEMGRELSGVRGKALRRSVLLEPMNPGVDPYLSQEAFEEPHRCGELFVAAMMNAFLEVWLIRIERLKRSNTEKQHLDRLLVVEQGADAADHLLTMAIRALDYTPPTDIRFADYLSAFLTADAEAVPDDSRYNYRDTILKSFRSYGIEPSSPNESGVWEAEIEFSEHLKYDSTHFESLMREPNEVFRFIWDNRKILGVDERAYTHVQSVRPCLRVAPDGFILRETVAEYVQIIELYASELEQLSPPIGKPDAMPESTPVKLYGGGTLIFDEYGRLKYHIANRIFSASLVGERIEYLWKYGHFAMRDEDENVFARMHLRRSAVFSNHFVEEEF